MSYDLINLFTPTIYKGMKHEKTSYSIILYGIFVASLGAGPSLF